MKASTSSAGGILFPPLDVRVQEASTSPERLEWIILRDNPPFDLLQPILDRWREQGRDEWFSKVLATTALRINRSMPIDCEGELLHYLSDRMIDKLLSLPDRTAADWAAALCARYGYLDKVQLLLERPSHSPEDDRRPLRMLRRLCSFFERDEVSSLLGGLIPCHVPPQQAAFGAVQDLLLPAPPREAADKMFEVCLHAQLPQLEVALRREITRLQQHVVPGGRDQATLRAADDRLRHFENRRQVLSAPMPDLVFQAP